MQTAVWMHLFRRIPEHQQNLLVLVTSTGLEIMVQSLLRLEMEFVVLRGRLAGSTEAGRIYFLPYDQISNLAINQLLKENEVHALFGSSPTERIGTARPAAAVAEEPALGPSPPEPPQPEPASGPGGPETPPPPKPAPAPPHSKSALLERVRARLKESSREQ